jgi:hypothetical protein
MCKRGTFPEDKASGDVKLVIHLNLVPKSRIVEIYLHFLIPLYEVELN